MKKTTNELVALKRRMADLEQHDEKLQLQNEALKTMIDLAERQFKIPIQKKSGRGGGPPQTVSYMSIQHPLVGMHKLCDLFGKSHQAWYEPQKQQDQFAHEYKVLLDKVRTIRRDLPRIGAEKLHIMTSDWCHQHGIKIGCDKFISLSK